MNTETEKIVRSAINIWIEDEDEDFFWIAFGDTGISLRYDTILAVEVSGSPEETCVLFIYTTFKSYRIHCSFDQGDEARKSILETLAWRKKDDL